MRREARHYYTKKERVRVMICAHSYWVEGDMYLIAGSRLTDLINVRAKDFFPITNAKVIDPRDNKVLYEIDFVAVNRDDIAMIFPLASAEATDGKKPSTGAPSEPEPWGSPESDGFTP